MDFWTCTQCHSLNTRSRASCYACGIAREPGVSGARQGRIRPLHMFMGVAAAAIVALGGVGAMTMLSEPQPAPPSPTVPVVAALPSVAPSAVPSANPAPTDPATTSSPTQQPDGSPKATKPPDQTDSPQHAQITPAKVVRSANWSGYGLRNQPYVTVSAEWTQPEVDCSAARQTDASIWVGLDGFKSKTVEQTGTAADCSAGSTRPSYFAWYEMYPAPAHEAAIVIKPGDHIFASVKAEDGGKFELTIKNLTNGESYTTTPSRSGGWPSSAEWVVEPAALCKPNCTISELSKFGDITFSNMAAGDIDGSVDFQAAEPDLMRFDLRSRKTGALANASALSGDAPAFDVAWVGTTH